MKYEFACPSCHTSMTVDMNPETFQEVKDDGLSGDDISDDPPCDCDDTYTYEFNPDDLDICWKGFEWPEKNYREKKYRKNRSKELAKRQKEKHPVPELKPNYKGQRTESWREAKNRAKKDAEPKLETTYDPLIRQEESES